MNKGDRVTLRDDVLHRHAMSIPAHMGYTTEEFSWRSTLRSCKGKVGIIERTFPNSEFVNVQFDDVMIGINDTELEEVK